MFQRDGLAEKAFFFSFSKRAHTSWSSLKSLNQRQLYEKLIVQELFGSSSARLHPSSLLSLTLCLQSNGRSLFGWRLTLAWMFDLTFLFFFSLLHTFKGRALQLPRPQRQVISRWWSISSRPNIPDSALTESKRDRFLDGNVIQESSWGGGRYRRRGGVRGPESGRQNVSGASGHLFSANYTHAKHYSLDID